MMDNVRKHNNCVLGCSLFIEACFFYEMSRAKHGLCLSCDCLLGSSLVVPAVDGATFALKVACHKSLADKPDEFVGLIQVNLCSVLI